MHKTIQVTLITACFGALLQTAHAADIPARVARTAPLMAPVVAAHSWTGCYIGANIGGGWTANAWDSDFGGARFRLGSHDGSGVIAGGQVGCDFQTGALVLGVEGMFDWAGIEGNHGLRGANFRTDVDWFATLTGRAGFAVDRVLLYVKGGAAWVQDDHRVTGFGLTASGDETRSGWTVGAGVEWALAPGWSAKLEYSFMDFGRDSPNLCIGRLGCARGLNVDQDVHTVLLGANFRFGGF